MDAAWPACLTLKLLNSIGKRILMRLVVAFVVAIERRDQCFIFTFATFALFQMRLHFVHRTGQRALALFQFGKFSDQCKASVAVKRIGATGTYDLNEADDLIGGEG